MMLCEIGFRAGEPLAFLPVGRRTRYIDVPGVLS